MRKPHLIKTFFVCFGFLSCCLFHDLWLTIKIWNDAYDYRYKTYLETTKETRKKQMRRKTWNW